MTTVLRYEKFVRELEKELKGETITVRSIIFILLKWEEARK